MAAAFNLFPHGPSARSQWTALGDNHGALDHFLQLSDVSRPRILGQQEDRYLPIDPSTVAFLAGKHTNESTNPYGFFLPQPLEEISVRRSDDTRKHEGVEVKDGRDDWI
jgi:hypothetical protein